MSDIFQLPRLLGEWEVQGPIRGSTHVIATVPRPSCVSVYVNGMLCAETDYYITKNGWVCWRAEAYYIPLAGDHVLIRAWESEPPPPATLRVVRPTILCSQCGEPMTPGDPRRRRRANAQPAQGYRCRPCGREVRP